MLQLSLRKVPTGAERFLASYEGEAGKPSILPVYFLKSLKSLGFGKELVFKNRETTEFLIPAIHG